MATPNNPLMTDPASILPLIKQPLEDLIRTDIENDSSGERHFQLRTLHKHERYWRGDHYHFPQLNRSAGQIEWNTATGNQHSAEKDRERGAYAYVLNYYQGDGQKLIGVLGRIPNAKAVADKESLSERADQASQIIKELWSHWKVEQLQPELVLSLYKNGTTFGYTPYVADEEAYGITEVPNLELRDVQISQEGFECQRCGEVTETLLAEEVGSCPCGYPFSPEDYRESEFAQIPEPTGEVMRYANGSVEFHLCTPYTVATPFYIKNLSTCPWLWYEYEEHKGTLLRTYPEAKARRQDLEGRGDTTALAAEGRFLREQAASPLQRHYQSHRPNYWRYSRFWLTPAMFESMEEGQAQARDSLLTNYPDGAKVTCINGQVIRVENERLSTVWAMCKPTVGEYAYSLSLGHNYPSMNDLINDGANIIAMTAEKGIPMTVFNPQMFDFKTLREHRALPAEYMPALPGMSGNIKDGIYQTPPAELNPATVQMMDMSLGAARDVSNMGKALWGAEQLERQTLGEAEMKVNRALQPHNTTWNFCRGFWSDVYTNGVTQYALHGGDRLYFRSPSPAMPPREVETGDLSGLLEGGWHVHCDEAIPMTWGQRRAQVWRIVEMGEPLWRLFGMAHPNNLGTLIEVLGMPDMQIPGADNVRKVASTILQLLESPPIEIPAPLPLPGQPPMPPQILPSIPVDEFEDDHELSVQSVREWSQTAEVSGRGGIRETNPQGYANVIAWGRGHLEILQASMMPVPVEGEGAGPNPTPPANAAAPPAPEADITSPRPEGTPEIPVVNQNQLPDLPASGEVQ